MAGNKLNAKTKTKDDRTKTSKNLGSANEESEDLDCTILRKPILTSITGFAQARKVFDLATEELKSLLSNECDILYECKVCRNIFRSLANFISHKRIYCKDRFDCSVHGHFVRTLSAASEISRIKKLEEMCKESLKDDDIDGRIPLTKDLTEILDRLASSRGKQWHQHENPEVVLQKIPKSNVAVFQSIREDDDDATDLMKAQIRELNMIMSRENAVLHNDGTFEVHSSVPAKKAKEAESVIQISDDENNDDGDILKCKICDLQFSTQKTLKFHMKYKHLESRLVFPCPDCLEIFSTSWSVYRHLFKVHRKTAAQIRRLRESIQAKAFKMNNPPAFYEKRKNNAKNITPQKITEEERLDQENQAWMDNLEGDGEVPRCGGCGRTFERRAALAAHTHTCQPRSRALARRPPDPRKIEIQIRKDYNKATPPPITLPLKIAEYKDKQTYEKTPEQPKVQREKENATEPMEEEQSKDNTQVNDSTQTNETMDESQIIKLEFHEVKSKLPFARQTEKNNFNSFTKRCEPDIELEKLLCKKCDSKFTKVTELHEHMAEHYKWLRYACKLCNFKHYSFEKLPEHVKVVHKLKGDTDFYYSTVKAIDGAEALQLSEKSKDANDSNETSPTSRRPSRCSSDSSRLSDDSSSSSTRIEGTRKRKTKYNKLMSKRKKEEVNEDIDGQKDSEASNDMLDENFSVSNVKIFEENSSDIDEVEEKSTKKSLDVSAIPTVTSRRPVRKRTNKKNEDFEYDLSNLLKMEAQGYRDSQTVVPSKSIPAKKKTSVEQQNNVFRHDKDCSGALAILSKKAVAISAAHLKCVSIYTQSDSRPSSNIFLRPLLPKISRIEKVSPKKDAVQVTDSPSVSSSLEKDTKSNINISKDLKEITYKPKKLEEPPKPLEDDKLTKIDATASSVEEKSPVEEKPANNVGESSATKLNIPNIIPLKLRRQSLDLMKNPLIKKNITDFTKAGMKTKILVIKPINRNNQQDGGKTINTPLKFQTIKLKDPNQSLPSGEVKLSDQVRVVQVPKVDRALTLPVSNACIMRNTNSIEIPTVKMNSTMTATSCDEKTPENTCEKDDLITDDPEKNIPEVLNSTNSEECEMDALIIDESEKNIPEVLISTNSQECEKDNLIIDEPEENIPEVSSDEEKLLITDDISTPIESLHTEEEIVVPHS